MGIGLKEQFTELMHELLEPVCPDGGLAYLLRRHPAGSYFPFAALLRKRPLSLSADTDLNGIPFYLMPFGLEEGFTHKDAETLRSSTSLKILSNRGRLEVLYLDPPVRQQVCSAIVNPNGTIPDMLLVVSANVNEIANSTESIYPMLAAVSSKALAIWTELARETFRVSHFKSLEEMTDAFFSRVCDQNPEPIYYPLLNADLSITAQGVSEHRTGINPLTYNCLLLQQRAHTLTYLKTMPRKSAKQGWYKDDLTADYADFAEYPAPVQAAAKKTIDLVVELGRGSHLFARHNRLRDDASPPPLMTTQEASQTPWNRLRRGIQYLAEAGKLGDDVLTTVWGFDSLEADANFIGLRPGRNQHCLAVTDAEGEKDQYQLGTFSVPTGVSRKIVQDQLNELSHQLQECASRLDPVKAAGLVWQLFAQKAHNLMPGDERGLHDIYSGNSRWREHLLERHHEVYSLVSACLDEVRRPFLPQVKTPPCDCEFKWQCCWSLHALWCIRKHLLHPSMLYLFGSEENVHHHEPINYYLWPKLDPEENSCWPVEMLSRFAILYREGGLKDIQLKNNGGTIIILCKFLVRNPEKWTATILREELIRDGGFHATNRAFSFFHQHAETIELTLLRKVSESYEGHVSMTFKSYAIQ